MPEPSWSFNAKQIILGVAAIVSVTLSTWGYISTKADESVVKALAEKVSTLADKKDVESLREKINEESTRRREDYRTLQNISDMLKETKEKIVKIEDGQVWQIQQEVKRLQWQSFKGEPPVTPPSNVNK